MNKDKIRAAVLTAVYDRGWQVEKETAGLVELTYKHRTARVTYGTSSFKVVQTGGDRDVTGWIAKLGSEINLRIMRTQE